jgi:hypothetical protein
VQGFLLARFHDAPQSYRQLEWFASNNDGRSDVAAQQLQYLIHAANQRPPIRPASVPAAPGWSERSQPPGSSDVEKTERIQQFLELMAANYQKRLSDESKVKRTKRELDYDQRIISETIQSFENSFTGHLHRETWYHTLPELVRFQPAWEEYANTFLNNWQSTKKRRTGALNKYGDFLLHSMRRPTQ